MTDDDWVLGTDEDGLACEHNKDTGEVRYADSPLRKSLQEDIDEILSEIEDDGVIDFSNMGDLGWAVDGSDPASIGIDQGESFDAEGYHLPRGTRPAWDRNGQYLPLGDEPEPSKKCPDCKGSGVYQGIGAPEDCKNCNGSGQG
jgi:hypothetical protein